MFRKVWSAPTVCPEIFGNFTAYGIRRLVSKLHWRLASLGCKFKSCWWYIEISTTNILFYRIDRMHLLWKLNLWLDISSCLNYVIVSVWEIATITRVDTSSCFLARVGGFLGLAARFVVIYRPKSTSIDWKEDLSLGNKSGNPSSLVFTCYSLCPQTDCWSMKKVNY